MYSCASVLSEIRRCVYVCLLKELLSFCSVLAHSLVEVSITVALLSCVCVYSAATYNHYVTLHSLCD
jgi:hypothetical protein